MSPEKRTEIASRFGVREEDVDLLLSAAVPERRWGRWPQGVVAIGLLISAGLAGAGVRTELLAFLARVNPPEPGELVPRQIPYRGFLERDGVPVSTPQSFSFKLEYGDGGTAWVDPSVTLPVLSGQFEVALGDSPSNKIPAAVFNDPFVLLSVSVAGVPLVGKQRLLTVPYAAASGRAFEAAGPLLAGMTQSASEIGALNAALSWANESELVVSGSPGGVGSLGTTDTAVVRFTTVDRLVGTAIARTSTPSAGDTFTIGEDGIYSVQVSFVGSPTGLQISGLTVNATPAERQAEIIGMPTTHKLLAQLTSAPSGYRQYPLLSGVFRLRQGDQLRVHAANGQISEALAVNEAWVRITKLLSTRP